jgi:myo-inositol-1(or 4)-monophosphatase
MKNPLDIAIDLAKETGEIQMSSLGKKHDVEFKGVINIVTEVDKKCEELIVNRLQKEFPSHDLLAEEGSGRRREAEYRWIIDPLDGTVNYNHGHPFFGPSLALERRGELVLGVVYMPFTDEIFIAEKGSGAVCNDKKINVSTESNLQNSLLATGFAYNVQEGEQLNNIEHFTHFIMKARAVRRGGMAEGDLCFLAMGRFEGFWELFLKPWDIAAGIVIIKEAGGVVTDFKGLDVDTYGSEIVASNGLIHQAVLDVLAEGK